jgi:hypothetical protein
MLAVSHGWMLNDLWRVLRVFLWYCYVILYFNQYRDRCCCLGKLSSTVWMLSWLNIHLALRRYLLLNGFSPVSWSCNDLEVSVIGCHCWSESLLCEGYILSDCLSLLIWKSGMQGLVSVTGFSLLVWMSGLQGDMFSSSLSLLALKYLVHARIISGRKCPVLQLANRGNQSSTYVNFTIDL